MNHRYTPRKLALLALAVAGFASAAVAAPKNWKVDKDHASVAFEINHFFTPVKGQFTAFDGVFKLDAKDLANAPSFEFSIDVASVNTANAKRDKHLQSNDFFDAKKWSVIRFTGSKVEKTGDNTYKAIGTLQMRDKSREVEVPFTLLGVQKVKAGLMSTEVMGIRIQTDLVRGDYGVGTGSWAAAAVVGEKVGVDILLELK
ncbi:MAG TPA: YceI family protein [Opitutaceae bacterium]